MNQHVHPILRAALEPFAPQPPALLPLRAGAKKHADYHNLTIYRCTWNSSRTGQVWVLDAYAESWMPRRVTCRPGETFAQRMDQIALNKARRVFATGDRLERREANRRLGLGMLRMAVSVRRDELHRAHPDAAAMGLHETVQEYEYERDLAEADERGER